ncbi:helix-turn-helix domain-containing protein [Mycolicibacter kumamotonensis]|jgi:transcriptional regulator with XRE-family HTH domain|uniref:XRE family transcriptional regulator n=1 Tax=Mycolicibacter kumamotonensis TaxID=354243 RepID=A0A1B8SGR8_9MYCO|nr:helix-turn-helix domain-containing protein [Mycolicibacter kumamotonensis]OBY31942.1 XRE family transcriptional regulator [Mycolicibacter kumamotonensis]
MPAAAHTLGFGSALRSWRLRRRLSQIELALASGTTQRHLSFLEQGRSAPGREIVERLAAALDLTLRERNALLGTAGFAPSYAETNLGSSKLDPIREALQHILRGHLPYPALIMDSVGDVIGANRAVGVLLDGVAPYLLEPPINVFRLALHPQGMAPRIANLDQWRRHVFDGLCQRLPDPRLETLIEELEGYGVPPRNGASADTLGFAVPLRLRTDSGDVRLVATISTFAAALDITISELRLEAFLPADRDTADILAHRHQVRDGRSVRPR